MKIKPTVRYQSYDFNIRRAFRIQKSHQTNCFKLLSNIEGPELHKQSSNRNETRTLFGTIEPLHKLTEYSKHLVYFGFTCRII